MRTKSISQKQSTNASTAAGSTAIRPFRINVPEEDLAGFRPTVVKVDARNSILAPVAA